VVRLSVAVVVEWSKGSSISLKSSRTARPVGARVGKGSHEDFPHVANSLVRDALRFVVVLFDGLVLPTVVTRDTSNTHTTTVVLCT